MPEDNTASLLRTAAAATRLAARYRDLDDPARAGELAEILAGDLVRLVIHAAAVSRSTN